MAKTRVLIVEDEEAISTLLDYNLSKEDFETRIATDGEEALRKLAEEQFDLVLTDISMPKVDGIAVFRKVIAEYPQTGVILITAFAKVSLSP